MPADLLVCNAIRPLCSKRSFTLAVGLNRAEDQGSFKNDTQVLEQPVAVTLTATHGNRLQILHNVLPCPSVHSWSRLFIYLGNAGQCSAPAHHMGSSGSDRRAGFTLDKKICAIVKGHNLPPTCIPLWHTAQLHSQTSSNITATIGQKQCFARQHTAIQKQATLVHREQTKP